MLEKSGGWQMAQKFGRVWFFTLVAAVCLNGAITPVMAQWGGIPRSLDLRDQKDILKEIYQEYKPGQPLPPKLSQWLDAYAQKVHAFGTNFFIPVGEDNDITCLVSFLLGKNQKKPGEVAPFAFDFFFIVGQGNSFEPQSSWSIQPYKPTDKLQVKILGRKIKKEAWGVDGGMWIYSLESRFLKKQDLPVGRSQ